MLQSGFTSVLQVQSRDELREAVLAFAKQLGFEKATAMAVVDRFRGEPDFFLVDNAPDEYMDIADSRDIQRLDPVGQHCKRASVPIIWNQQTYTAAGLGNQWETQASFGYRTGIALALHLPEGRHFVMGVDRDQSLPASPAEVTRMVADLQ